MTSEECIRSLINHGVHSETASNYVAEHGPIRTWAWIRSCVACHGRLPEVLFCRGFEQSPTERLLYMIRRGPCAGAFAAFIGQHRLVMLAFAAPERLGDVPHLVIDDPEVIEYAKLAIFQLSQFVPITYDEAAGRTILVCKPIQ